MNSYTFVITVQARLSGNISPKVLYVNSCPDWYGKNVPVIIFVFIVIVIVLVVEERRGGGGGGA